MKEEKINNLIYKVKSDSILREEPLSFSNKFITVLASNTEVEYLNETKEENDEVKYDKVKIINNKNDKEQIGWILHKQIILRKKSLSIESKNNILKTINQYLNLPTAYSMEFPQRNYMMINIISIAVLLLLLYLIEILIFRLLIQNLMMVVWLFGLLYIILKILTKQILVLI